MNAAISFAGRRRASAGPATQPPRVSEFALRAWIIRAEPGDALEYHRGFLAIDRTPLGAPMSVEERSALGRTGVLAMRLATEGGVHLVQRRLGPDSCSYLAVARRRPRNAPASPAALPLEEAA